MKTKNLPTFLCTDLDVDVSQGHWPNVLHKTHLVMNMFSWPYMLQTCTNLNVRGNIQASEQERVKTCNVVLVLEMLVGGVLYITTSVSTVDLPAIAFWVQEFKSLRVQESCCASTRWKAAV